MKVKVLFVYHVSQIGGGSYTLLNIIKELDRALFTPYVVLREKGPLSEELDKLGVEVFFLSRIRAVPYNRSIWTKESFKNIVNILLSIRGYKKILDSIKPDIVHVNSMMLYPYLIIPSKRRIKSIIHIREHWPEGEHTIQRKYANTIIRNYSDSVFAINTYSASMLKGIENKTHVVYDWIDMDARFEYTPLSQYSSETEKIYLFTGGIQPIKGIHQVLKAFTEVVKEENARLLILGGVAQPKSGETPQFIQTAIDRDSRIILLPSIYNITHILQQTFCVLSYFTIPHANLALAESIITKTPVLAAKTPESLEYSKDGKYAKLFEFNNYDDFCKCLSSVEEWIGALRERLNEGSGVIKNMFDTNRNSEIIQEVYLKSLKSQYE